MLIHETENTEKKKKFPERRMFFAILKKNAFFEILLQILKIVLSIKLISFYVPFLDFDLLVRILLSNVRPFSIHFAHLRFRREKLKFQ